MGKNVGDCDLYKQPEEVIKEYEDKAFLLLAKTGKIDCCGGGHPRDGRHKKMFERTVCDMYEADKRKKKRKRTLDKFK